MPPAPMGWGFWNTGATGTKVVDIAYTKGGKAALRALLHVNGQLPTKVSFPPTGSWLTPCTVSVEVSLAMGWSNTLTFPDLTAWTPDFDIEARPLPATNGVQAVIWDRNGQTNQQWNLNADGALTNVHAGLCPDATGGATASGTKLVLWTCNGGNNQKRALS